MVITQQLPAWDSKELGSTSTVKLDIFSRLLHHVDVEVIGTRTAGDGVNYTGKTGAAITAIAPSDGTGATGTLTVSSSGVPTAIAIVAGGSGWAVGDKFTVFDPTGHGLVCTVATVSSGAIATATIGGGPIFVEDCIEYFQVVADTNVITTFKPETLRKIAGGNNLNRDVIDKGMIRIPFAYIFHMWSQWGSKDIGQLQLQAKIKDTVAGTLTKLAGCYDYVPVSTPLNRGDIIIQTDIPITNTIAGWNKINDLPWQRVVALTQLLFNSPAITQVKVKVGDKDVYNRTKRQVLFEMGESPNWRVPDVDDYFLCNLDRLLAVEEFVYIVQQEGSVASRRNVEVEFYWDENIAAPATFYILARGLERGAKEAVAVAKA